MQANTQILIVDGDQDVAEVLAFKLIDWGFEVETCSSGETGFERAKQTIPDLVVIDSMVQSVSSLELCRAIRADATIGGTPVIFIVSRGENETLERAHALGANSFIVKPVDPAELVARINSLTQRRAS